MVWNDEGTKAKWISATERKLLPCWVYKLLSVHETEMTTLHVQSRENKHNSTTVTCSSNAMEAEQNQETKKLI